MNLYRHIFSRTRCVNWLAWSLRQAPEASDRRVAKEVGVNHRTVAGVRRRLESDGEILHRGGSDGKRHPAAEPTAFACSASEARRARSLLDRPGDDTPARP